VSVSANFGTDDEYLGLFEHACHEAVAFCTFAVELGARVQGRIDFSAEPQFRRFKGRH